MSLVPKIVEEFTTTMTRSTSEPNSVLRQLLESDNIDTDHPMISSEPQIAIDTVISTKMEQMDVDDTMPNAEDNNDFAPEHNMDENGPQSGELLICGNCRHGNVFSKKDSDALSCFHCGNTFVFYVYAGH